MLLLLLLMLLLSLATLPALTVAVPPLPVGPCDNFYQYVCGEWLHKHSIPEDQQKYSKSFSNIQQRNTHVLKQILEADWPVVTPFYHSCLSLDAIDAIGIAPLSPLLSLFSSSNVTSLSVYWHHVGLLLHEHFWSPLLSVSVEIDDKHTDKNWLVFDQGGLSLSSASMYHNNSVLHTFRQHIVNMLRLANYTEQQALQDADNVILLETMIANITTPPEEMRDPHVVYNPSNLTHMQQLAKEVDWDAVWRTTKLSPDLTVNLDSPRFFSHLSNVLASLQSSALPVLLSHGHWHILHRYARDLTTPLQRENFLFFSQYLHGIKSPSAIWKQCIQRTIQQLGQLTGRYYMQQQYSLQTQQAVQHMIQYVFTAMKQRLPELVWMDRETREAAEAKLSAVMVNLGGPQNFSTAMYEGVWIQPTQFLENLLQLQQWHATKTWQRLRQSADRQRWEMTASEVNAYYEPTTNSINFPAGIIQTPFFQTTQKAESHNYGGLGFIIGHELSQSHGFDDVGRSYDGSGALVDWWSAASSGHFTRQVSCFVSQYNSMFIHTAAGAERVNGRLTLGENIADNAGLRLAYQAYHMAIDNSSESHTAQLPSAQSDVLFFHSFADDWCQQVTPKSAHISLLVDVHAPAEARVNGPLQNMEEFAAAYACPINSYMNPLHKCRLF